MNMRRRPPRPDPVAEAGLPLECELVLAGRYAPFLDAQRRPVAPWAWAGVLAHASGDDLGVWAAADTSAGVFGEWRAAVAFLARDLLNHARTTGTALETLQRSTLVPIELELMSRGDGAGITPAQLAGRVLAAVHHHPTTER